MLRCHPVYSWNTAVSIVQENQCFYAIKIFPYLFEAQNEKFVKQAMDVPMDAPAYLYIHFFLN